MNGVSWPSNVDKRKYDEKFKDILNILGANFASNPGTELLSHADPTRIPLLLS